MFTVFSFCAFLGMILLIAIAAVPSLWGGWNRLGIVSRLDGALGRASCGKWMVLVLLVLGALIRIWQLMRVPAMTPEEAWTALEAQSLWQDGVSMGGKSWPALLTGWGGEAEGPLLAWLSMVPVALLGPVVLAVRLPLSLLSCLAALALWDTARRTASKEAALWVLLLCVCSPWHILQSRFALGWELLPHLLVIALWMALKPCPKGIWQTAAFLPLVLAMYTGDTAWYVVPLFALVMAGFLWLGHALRWWQALIGLLVFFALSLPSLVAFCTQVFSLPGKTVVGMEIPVMEDYAHATDGLWAVERHSDPERYVPMDEDLEMASGLEFLSLLRGWLWAEQLWGNLATDAYRMVDYTLLQGVSEAVYTQAFLLPQYGILYLFSIPLGLLGAFLFMIRRLWQPNARRGRIPPRKLAERLCIALYACTLPFLLLHRGLSTAHYAVLYYPVILLTAYALVFLARRVRGTALLLTVLYAFALGGFLMEEPEASQTFPGFDEAVEAAAAEGSQQVVISSRLYPHANPPRAAEGKTILGFDLPAGYVRGEEEMEGFPPYAKRFSYVYLAAHDMSSTLDAVYIVHDSEAYTLSADGYNFFYFEDYATLVPWQELRTDSPSVIIDGGQEADEVE